MTPLFQGMRRRSEGGRWCGGGHDGYGRSPRPKSRQEFVAERMQRRPLFFGGGGGGFLRVEVEARGLKLKRPDCLA